MHKGIFTKNVIQRLLPSIFFPMALPSHSGHWPLIQFRHHISETAGLLGRVIGSSQGLYLNTGQHTHTK
jgi:hypothetical protein